MELRRVGVEDLEDVLPLLLKFRNRRMSREDWQRMLFSYPWPSQRRHGYGYYEDGVLLGFLGTIFSQRRLAGRTETVCSFSSWVVEERARGTSVLMVRPLLRDLEGVTITGFTPAPTTCAVFQRFGFRPFETTRLILAPLPPLGSLRRSLGASATFAPERIRERLTGLEAEILRDTLPCPRVRHVLLTRGEEQCYLVARLDRPRHLRAAELLYIGNLPLFWDLRALVHAAFLRSMGAAELVVDGRYAQGRKVGAARPLPRVRLFRPSRPEITPDMIDGLYSELMTLRE